MNLNKEKIFILTSILVGSVILSSALVSFGLYFSKNSKGLVSYDLPNFIHINNNWSKTASNYAWCKSGSGTENNPYIIENIVVESDNEIACIFIENSNKHFIIRNCKFKNSNSIGIYLSHVSNGKLIENDCSSNYEYGIYLYSCNYLEIIGNSINSNSNYGITLHGSDYNTIKNNKINYNYDAITLIFSSHNIIQENDVNGNYDQGLSFYHESTHNKIENNSFSYNGCGVYTEEGGIYNIFIGNNATSNKREGFDIGDSYNIVSQNIANFNGWYGIRISFGDNSSILNNTANSNDIYGIYVVYSDVNEINNNTILGNNQSGICLRGSDDCLIEENIIEYSGNNGILLITANYNQIIGNKALNNYYGIKLEDESNSNEIIENILTNNTVCYFEDSSCSHNTYEDNIC